MLGFSTPSLILRSHKLRQMSRKTFAKIEKIFMHSRWITMHLERWARKPGLPCLGLPLVKFLTRGGHEKAS